MYLLQDQLSRGNASLHLSQCGIKDRGRYRCQVNSTLGQQESFIIMKVEGYKNREIQCLSKDIFPAPRVQWSTLPPKANLRSTTHMAPNTEGLYSVQSKLRMFGNTPTYVCTVNSTYGSQSWKSSLQKGELTGEAGRELSIPCMAPHNLQNFSLTWTFTRTNEPTVILNYDSRPRRTSNLWEGRTRLEHDQVLMGNGSLLLCNPENQEHTGTYTCIFSGFQSSHVEQTQVNITVTPIGRRILIKCIGFLHYSYTLLKKIKGTLKQYNVTPSQSHFCEIKLST
uniref:Ig-like domain-containing protein n=1 Tax=Salmo trutta TaxID=8032 RepID=A0A673WHV8_SALTR